jgi:hypothetical protein
MTIRADHEETVAAEASMLNPVSGLGWPRRSPLVRGKEFEFAAQDALVQLHRFSGVALEVDIWPNLLLH